MDENLDQAYEVWLDMGTILGERIAVTNPHRMWHDNRLNLLHHRQHWNELTVVPAANIVTTIPIGGTVIDLACGDGFMTRHVYAERASHILAIDSDPRALELAVRYNSSDNIDYALGDIANVPAMLTRTQTLGAWDVVALRGGAMLPHWTVEERRALYQLASDALKPGGTFAGDSEADISEELEATRGELFEVPQVWKCPSPRRPPFNTMWRCRK